MSAKHESLVKHLQNRDRKLTSEIERRKKELTKIKTMLSVVLSRRQEG